MTSPLTKQPHRQSSLKHTWLVISQHTKTTAITTSPNRPTHSTNLVCSKLSTGFPLLTKQSHICEALFKKKKNKNNKKKTTEKLVRPMVSTTQWTSSKNSHSKGKLRSVTFHMHAFSHPGNLANNMSVYVNNSLTWRGKVLFSRVVCCQHHAHSSTTLSVISNRGLRASFPSGNHHGEPTAHSSDDPEGGNAAE